MKKLMIFGLFWASAFTFGQVGLGTDTPHESADLELGSTDKALMLNRVADASVINNPENGMMIYDISTQCVKTYQENAWSDCIFTGIPTPLNSRLGGAGDERQSVIQQTSDGGYIIIGESANASADNNDQTGEISKGSNDYWIVKLDIFGNMQWQKRYGGTGTETVRAGQQTSDGGYIIAGHSTAGSANTGDQTGSAGKGGDDCWIVKINSSGTIQWHRRYGGAGNEGVRAVQQTSDGGYIIGGYSAAASANTGDQAGDAGKGGIDYWIVKINSSGTIEWQKRYGGTADDLAYAVQQTNDGGYIITGVSDGMSANSGDQAGSTGKGGYDYWVVKLNSSGTIEWQKRYGGAADDISYAIHQTSDDGYIMTGESAAVSANTGDQTGVAGKGSVDYWIVKLNNSGTIEWQKRYGGVDVDIAHAVIQTSDGGYITVGYSASVSANHGDQIGTASKGSYDYWVVKLNSSGTIQWQKRYGGAGSDVARIVIQNEDGTYIIAGDSQAGSATTGDQAGLSGRGAGDYWILKVGTNGNIVQ